METFWDFSIRTYRTPGVPDACLSLQNDHGADVNMLLFCAWTGAVTGVFDDDLFRRASEYSGHWVENVVGPLRNARTWMKHTGCELDLVPTETCMELREDVKEVEFAAEKMQQEVLEKLVSIDRARDEKPGRIIDDVAANLMLYLHFMEIQIEVDVREKLSAIILAAFPEIEPKTVAKAFAN